eukprot:TRINITY_DN32533_c0_g1_i2.p1 TRINITY_DN32533_c0_g1~~TRINITY_DN32533_c0_g1_i2.p1  ORF type:complete len:146 (-),score=25.31 TRINITY_DN32533_c0_g1_i2:128-565(-)
MCIRDRYQRRVHGTAMIPGINNIPSIGSRPTCRGGKEIVNTSFMNVPSSEPRSTRKINASFDQRMFEEPKLDHASAKSVIPSPSSAWGKYNPITNPIPNFNQNPYIMRERVRATTEIGFANPHSCLLYTSPSPRDLSTSRMPSSA